MEILQDITYTHSYWIFLLPVVGAVADIITGWIQASINGTWDSTKMRTGLYRKGGELLIVILAFIAEYALDVVAKAHVATLLSIYIVLMELFPCWKTSTRQVFRYRCPSVTSSER